MPDKLINELAYMQETKDRIKTAIETKGGSIQNDTPFREYVASIHSIPSPIIPEWDAVLYGELIDKMDAYVPSAVYDHATVLQEAADTCVDLIDFYEPMEDNVYDFLIGVPVGGININFPQATQLDVDFGEGYIDCNVIGGTSYFYDLLPEGNLTKFGEKQVIIKLKIKDTITSFSLNSSIINGNNILAIRANGPKVNSISITTTTSLRRIEVYENIATSLSFTYCYNLTYVKHLNLSSSITSLNSTFKGCYNLLTIPLLDTTNVTNIGYMFDECESLKVLPNFNFTNVITATAAFQRTFSLVTIPEFDLSNVTNMSSCFSNSAIEYLPNLNTSSCTNFSSTFNSCNKLYSLKNIDTSSCIYAGSMFYGCYSLETVPVLDFNLCTNLASTFGRCYNLLTVPTLDTSSVTSMLGIFDNCSELIELPELNTSSCTNFRNAFKNCKLIKNVYGLNTTNATDLESMFEGCESLEAAPILDVSKVTNFKYMFKNCYAIKSTPTYNTVEGLTFTGMFNYCTNLELLGEINLYKATDISSMFAFCYKLKNVPDLDMPDVTTASSAFANCGSIESLPYINTPNCLNHNSMFLNMFSLVDSAGMNLNKSENVSSLFNSCYNLTTLPELDLQNVENATFMFNSCYKIEEINLTNTQNIKNYGYMFMYMKSLKTLNGFTIGLNPTTTYDTNNIFTGCYALREQTLDAGGALGLSALYDNCHGLDKVTLLNTQNVTNMYGVFRYCRSLREIIGLDLTSCTDATSLFQESNSLISLGITNISTTIDLKYTKLPKQNILDIFNELEIVVGKTITLPNYGVADKLTAEELAIATDKGWTISY